MRTSFAIAALSSFSSAARIALLGAQLFWTEPQAGRVRTMSIKGAGVTDVASDQVAPGRLAVDDSGVYWVDSGDGTAGAIAQTFSVLQ